jgi:long-chain fatty acid transport protein
MKTGSRRASLALLLLALAGGAHAAGFALFEFNASGTGNGYAGAAAVAEDASTVWYNPAGMTRLPRRQVIVAGNFISSTSRYYPAAVSTSPSCAGNPFAGATCVPALQGPLGDAGGNGGTNAFVPAGAISWPLSDRWWVGVAVTSPFGLETNWDDGWQGRFHAVQSRLITVDINPSVAYKVSDAVSLGFGINALYADGKFTNSYPYSTAAYAAGGMPLVGAIGGPGREGLVTLKGTDWAWGWNVGAQFDATPATRIGITYRSRIKVSFSGSVNYADRPLALAGALPDGGADADVTLPDIAVLAVAHWATERLQLLADVTWTHWSTVQNLTFTSPGGGQIGSTTLDYKDAWRLALGANYQLNDTWKLRGGIAFDQTPVQNAYRVPRVPDQDRIAVSAGVQYRLSRDAAIDVGYAYVSFREAASELVSAAQGNLVGTYKSHSNIIGVQYRTDF